MNKKTLFSTVICVMTATFITLFGVINVYAGELKINQDPADYTYFHSKHYNVGAKYYKNTTFTSEDGTSYIAEPMDYTNPEKGERIILTKTDSTNANSVYFKTNLTKRTECWPSVSYPYHYYYLEGDFMIENNTLDWNLITLYHGTKTISIYVEDGILKFNNGSTITILPSVKTGEWHHILVLFNLIDHKADIFYDRIYAGNDVTIKNDITKLDTAECKLYGGNGSVEMKNWEFTGIVKPYNIVSSAQYGYEAEIEHTSVFPDDTIIRDYLSDKVVFHGEGKILYKNGQKTAINSCEYTDDELFVNVNEINSAMGLSLKINKADLKLTNGDDTYNLPQSAYGEYLPVTETLSMLGYDTDFARYGKMVIVCKREGIIFTETQFIESANKYPSDMTIVRQRGFVKTGTVDTTHGTSMILGMDANCDTVNFNSNQYTFIQHKMDTALAKQIYEFDVNVLSAPTKNAESVKFAIRYSDGYTQTLFSIKQSEFVIPTAVVKYNSGKWYHIKVEVTEQTWKVTVTAPDGTMTTSGNGAFDMKKTKDQFRFHTSNDAANLYSVAIDNIKVTAENPIIDCTYRESWFDNQYYASSSSYPILSFSDEEEISNFIFFDRPDAKKLESDFNANISTGEHPRIMINSEDVDRLRILNATDKKFAAMAKRMINSANSYLTAELPVYLFNDNIRTLTNANNVERRLKTLAFAYVLTGDTKYSDRVIDELMLLCEFPDLNAKHIIDTGVWLRGISIAYDWCYHEMNDTQRQKVEEFIYREGIEPVWRAYYSMNPAGAGGGFQQANWFVRWKSNYTPFVQGGFVPACLAVADVYPEICFDALEKATRSWEYMLYGFYDDGAWLESKSYESVVYTGVSYAMASMMKCFGDDYNILEYIGIKKSFTAAAAMTSLVGSFTYGDDSHSGALTNIGGPWSFFGDYYNDDLIKGMRGMCIHGDYKSRYFGNFSSPDFMDLVYYDGNLTIDAVKNMPKIITADGMDLFSLSEDKTDKDALYFASSGGVSRHYHQHNDSGDFFFALDGVQWTYEFGMGNYNVGNIYKRFSGRTEAHNTITLNPGEGFSQAESAYAPLTEYSEGEGSGYAVYDMTELYSHHGAESMTRGFYIGEGYNSLTVRDEMSFSQDTVGYWFMNTLAEMEQVDANTIKLTRSGKTLYAQFICEADNATAKMSIMDCVILGSEPLEGDLQAQTGQKKIGIYFEGSGDIAITVRLSNTLGTVDKTPVSQWKNKILTEKYEKPTEPEREAEEFLWQEDFEGDSPQMPTIVSKKSYTKAEVVGNEDNRELFVYSNRTSITSADSAVNLFYDSTLNAKENFTVEYDMKIIPYNPDTMLGYDGDVLKYSEYNVGLSDAKIGERAYFTINPYFNDLGVFSGINASVFGAASRNKSSVFGFIDGVNWYDYNRYRWVKKTDASGNQYAEVYINGKFYGVIGNRYVDKGLKGLMFSVTMNKGICEAGFYVDNIKFYKGQAESVDKDCYYTENDVVCSFDKDFEDLSEKTFDKSDTIYPYYQMRNASYDAYVGEGQISAVNGVYGKKEINTSLKLTMDATAVFPQAIQIKDTTVLEFETALENGGNISFIADNITQTPLLISISEDTVIMTDKTYSHNTEPEMWHKVRMVIENDNGRLLATLHIDDTIITFREEITLPEPEFSSQYMNVNINGTGYIDNLNISNMRGTFAKISDVAVDMVDSDTMRVRIKEADIETVKNPTVYVAIYNSEGLVSVSTAEAKLANGEYCAELDCTDSVYDEAKIFIWDNKMYPLEDVIIFSK